MAMIFASDLYHLQCYILGPVAHLTLSVISNGTFIKNLILIAILFNPPFPWCQTPPFSRWIKGSSL